jgi:ATP-dependent exoDNAse (exonuclease V) alpha subunit
MLDHRGRFTETPTADDAAAHMVHDWYEAIAAGDDAVMLAARRADVANLNRRARALLVAQHRITGVAVNAAGRSYAAGDLIVTLRNDRQLGLLNGQRGSVVRADPIRRSLLVRFDDDPHHRVVPAEYLDDGNIDHGYALTIHKAQGLTCDRAFILADDTLYAEAGYTALTRGRVENHLYLAADARERDAHDDEKPDPVGDVRRALQRSTRDSAAIDLLRPFTADVPSHDSNVSERDAGVDIGW